MKKERQHSLTEYENQLLAIIDNVVEKISASLILYNTKSNYNSSFFLAIIAQEELAKLIMLPIAREIGNVDELLSSRKGGFYSHKIKQKLFSSYTFFERNWEVIEDKKQNSLYSGINDENKIENPEITREECFQELKNGIFVFQYQMKVIEDSKIFPQHFINILLGKTSELGKVVGWNIPDLGMAFFRDVDKAVEEMVEDKNKAKTKMLESLFKNPYNMVEIIKAALGNDYKDFLRKIQGLSFSEMVRILGEKLEEIEKR